MTGRKRNPAADLGDESSEDEPITQALSKRGRIGTSGGEEGEEQQDPASEPDEDQPGPSNRRRTSRRQRGDTAEETAEEELPQEEEAPRKKKKKNNRKEKKASRKRKTETQAQGSDGEDSDAAADGDGELERAAPIYEVEATQASLDSRNLISEAEEAKLVRDLMRFMLFHQHQKPGVPVKRQDLTNIIVKGYRGSGRLKKLGSLIIKKAQFDFVTSFGMELKEVTPQLHTRHGQENGPTVYVLRSLLPANLRNFAKSQPMDLNNAFVMVVASIITLAGGKLTEDDLELQLEKIGVILNDRHPVLGKPIEQLQTLVQKKLLAESRENGPDGVKKVYAVGDCFLDEVQTDNLTNFIEKVFSHAPLTQAKAA